MKYCNAIQVNRVRGAVLRSAGLMSLILCLSMWVPSGLSQAAGFSSPKECQSLAGDAHLNCLYTYIERQRNNAAALESDRNPQTESIEQTPTQRTPVDPPTSIADDGQGEPADRTVMPQAAPVERPSDAITPGIGSPAECRAYSGTAHLNCLYAYIEIQRSKAGNVEQELSEQKHRLGQLRDQMDRQTSANQDQQRQLAERNAPPSSSASIYVAPPIYPGYAYPGYGYPYYGYPAPGFSLYLGVPGFYYGRPFYGPRFSGPRFYGHHHHR
jgi:hypothetical protein